MSLFKSGPETSFFEKSDLAQEKKKEAIKDASKFKQEAIAAANAPLGLCGIIAVLILVAIVAPTSLGVLVLFA